jgi:two-component system, NtrC family, response regulator AtoC
VAKNITETARLLVVSQESSVLRPLWAVAEPNSWNIETASSAWDAIERVQSGGAPDLLLLDFPPGDSDSLRILRWMRRLQPNLPVIVICSSEDAGREREATRLGANEVLLKPFDEAHLESAIQRHLSTSDSHWFEVGSEDIEQLGPDSFFVSASHATQKLRAQAELLAEADVPVLILGETGSGKETVARLIHARSVRSGFPFLKVNCADMPEDLLDVELFGSEKGLSPSGRTSTGKIERAEKGTILLDEITEMPLSVQGRLMEVLQDKVWWRPGSEPAASVDVRILAATSASIDRALAQKRLREDLYYRLSAFTVQVPSLRQRKSEIAILLQHLMHRLSRQYTLPARDFSQAVFAACQQYSWPGNVRELEKFAKRYLVAGDAESILNDLKSGRMDTSAQKSGDSTSQIRPSAMHVVQEPPYPRSLKSLIQNVKSEAERNAIGSALQKTGWNRKAAARLLQVSYRTLLYKIDQYHMSSEDTLISPLSAEKIPFHGATTRPSGKE